MTSRVVFQVWRQKAQYLQHKQNKAEATTVKHKSAPESKSKGDSSGFIVSPPRPLKPSAILTVFCLS